MASESKTYQIRASDQCEIFKVDAGGASAEQIKKWLNDTDAGAVVGAADAYSTAASMVEMARGALQSAAKELSEMWGGPTAALFQAGLQKLDKTGEELATKMKAVSTKLTAYGATDLPDAIKKMDAVNPVSSSPLTPKPSPGPSPNPSPTASLSPTHTGGSPTVSASPSPYPLSTGQDSITAAIKAKQDEQARKVLEELNTKIVQLYNQLPTDVSYDVEIPTPAGSDGYRRTSYSAPEGIDPLFRGGTPGSPDFDMGDNSPGTGGGTRPGSGGGGTNPYPGGDRPGGTSPGGDGSTPTNPDNPNNPDKPGSGPGPDTPGAGPGAPGGPDAPGAGSGDGGATGRGPGDGGTTPAVIGHESSRQTESSSYTPTQTVSAPPPTTSTPYGHPPTTNPTLTTTPGQPNVFVGPTNNSPGVTSVIGNGSVGGATGVTSAASRGGFGMGGAPFLPMGAPGGVIGGEENPDNAHSTALKEDRDPWNSPYSATSSLIGVREEA